MFAIEMLSLWIILHNTYFAIVSWPATKHKTISFKRSRKHDGSKLSLATFFCDNARGFIFYCFAFHYSTVRQTNSSYKNINFVNILTGKLANGKSFVLTRNWYWVVIFSYMVTFFISFDYGFKSNQQYLLARCSVLNVHSMSQY